LFSDDLVAAARQRRLDWLGERVSALIQPDPVWDGRRIGNKRIRWRRISEPMPVTT
jgi:hypothetical protein